VHLGRLHFSGLAGAKRFFRLILVLRDLAAAAFAKARRLERFRLTSDAAHNSSVVVVARSLPGQSARSTLDSVG